MRNWLKSALLFCLYYSGLEWLLARLIPVRGVAILMYHGVCDNAPIPANINFHVGRKVFEQHMRALHRRYRVLPLADVVSALERGEPPGKGIIITFDDGYRNNAVHAAPVMSRLRLPYAVFVATSYVETGQWIPINHVYWLWSEGKLDFAEMTERRKSLRMSPSARAANFVGAKQEPQTAVSTSAAESFAMLNWDEIRQMATAGAAFGSHTHSHCNLTVEDESSRRQELIVSKKLLETNLGCRIDAFAYPYGMVSADARKSVVEAGYKCALSTDYGITSRDSDRFQLPRLGTTGPIWFFLGEILYQFTKRAVGDLRSSRSSSEELLPKAAEERHG